MRNQVQTFGGVCVIDVNQWDPEMKVEVNGGYDVHGVLVLVLIGMCREWLVEDVALWIGCLDMIQ